jgi:hypothetical protein
MAHENEWDRFLIYARTMREAARAAADRNLWLHSWLWVESDEDPRVEEAPIG